MIAQYALYMWLPKLHKKLKTGSYGELTDAIPPHLENKIIIVKSSSE